MKRGIGLLSLFLVIGMVSLALAIDNENYFDTALDCSGGTNIIGDSCIGGNYWTDPDGNYSDTCVDGDGNGVCDVSYPFDPGYVWAVDQLPLTRDSTVPTGSVVECGARDTCQAAIDSASPGDVVRLTADLNFPEQGPSPSRAVFLDINGGGGVTLDCDGHILTAEFFGNPGDDDNDDVGIEVVDSGNTVKNCIIRNFGSSAIQVTGTDNTFENIEISGSGFFFGASEEEQSAIGIKADNNTFINIRLIDNYGRAGFYIKSSYNKFIDCESIRTCYRSVCSVGGVGFLLSGGITEDAMYNTFERLISRDNWRGVMFYADGSGMGDEVCNNIFIEPSVSGNYEDDWSGFEFLNDFTAFYLGCNGLGSPSSVTDCDTYSQAVQLAIPGSTIVLNNNIIGVDWRTCIDFNGNDGVTFDCNGYVISGDFDGDGSGIYLSDNAGGSDGNTIKNCAGISGFEYGIIIDGDSDNNIVENSFIFDNSGAGIFLNESGTSHPEYNRIYNNYLNNIQNILLSEVSAPPIPPSSSSNARWEDMDGNEITEAQVGDTVRMNFSGHGYDADDNVIFEVYEDDGLLGETAIETISGTVASDLSLIAYWTITEENYEDGDFLEPGANEFRFKADAENGSLVRSPNLDITETEDNSPMVVTVDYPPCGSDFSAPDTINIGISASDSDDYINGLLKIYDSGGVLVDSYNFSNGGLNVTSSLLEPGNSQIVADATTSRGERMRAISSIMMIDQIVDGTYVAACISNPKDYSNIGSSTAHFNASGSKGIRRIGGVNFPVPFSDMNFYWTFSDGRTNPFISGSDPRSHDFHKLFMSAGDNWAELSVEVI